MAGSRLAEQGGADKDKGKGKGKQAGDAKTKRTVDEILNAFRSSVAGSGTDRSGSGSGGGSTPLLLPPSLHILFNALTCLS